MTKPTNDEVRAAVQEQYGSIARSATGGCCVPGTCGLGAEASLGMGYSAEDLEGVPEGANMGLGCGNPQAIAGLEAGETVLDLGAGGGFDCFLAAKQVGPTGQVIGVDMTPDMVSKARANARKLGTTNVDFRLGEIEHLPVADNTVDVILSNCVINLSPDKAAVFRDAFRVLKAGGRLAISDVVSTKTLPEALRNDVGALTGCIAGAVDVATVERLLEEAGFENVRVMVKEESREFIRDWMPGSGIEDYIASATIEATKPERPEETGRSTKRTAAPAVDFVYADDCPNVDAARANLRAACVARGLSTTWAEHRIGDPGLPDRVRGFGSPTILVDGRDVAGARPEAEHCCRVYSTGGGVPSVELIVAALEKAATRGG